MQFRVLWATNAEERLEQFLANAPDAHVLAEAARTIDQHLLSSPNSFGESRYDTMRVGYEFPFGVQFEVLNDVRSVIVHDIWRIDRK